MQAKEIDGIVIERIAEGFLLKAAAGHEIFVTDDCFREMTLLKDQEIERQIKENGL